MTDQELRDVVASLAVKHAEIAELQRQTQQQLQETDRQLQETDRQLQETDRTVKEIAQDAEFRLKETDRQLRELGKQIGGLGDKFGGFTEGMAFPSMKRILQERFGMEFIAARAIGRKNGRSMELDVLAHSNDRSNEVYVVEVKSRLRQDGLEQLLKKLRELRDYFPHLRDKKLYGILAAVDIPDEVADNALKAGVYLARIHDEEFQLRVPPGFQPRAF